MLKTSKTKFILHGKIGMIDATTQNQQPRHNVLVVEDVAHHDHHHADHDDDKLKS